VAYEIPAMTVIKPEMSPANVFEKRFKFFIPLSVGVRFIEPMSIML
jgi:hypothetical protein